MTREGKDNDYGEMTNEECKEELRGMFEPVENNKVLRYFCKLVPKLLKEWT